jgi:hypothetical protein
MSFRGKVVRGNVVRGIDIDPFLSIPSNIFVF